MDEYNYGSKTIHTLVERWLHEISILRSAGAASQADLMERMIDDLDRAISAHRTEALVLSKAAEESGYSRTHLGRLVRESVIPNAGKRGAPSILRCNLPTKAGQYQSLSGQELLTSRKQIARSVVDSMNGGSDG